ncbi:MAG TPA: FG-GAP-like repeat-containing protein, partial [Microbacteriaceae bacterium]|nr:FG-GAP-like repeat-containing protein [Microbacteriaceae bacterium]
MAAATILVQLCATGVAADLVGTLPGEFSVDNKGSANYSIPLSIPPGRQGMQPKLSLNYNSQLGNGPLGVGFSLSTGFPQAITRGRSILARDGETRGVTFDNTKDKLYLDGKRLICVSGTYGAPGSIYRTEVDSFVSITTTGSNGNIETFVVTDKSGVKSTFGKLGTETDGYQYGMVFKNGAWVPDTMANEWALKRVEDVAGGKVDLKYIAAGGGEYLLGSLEYTGHSNVANVVPAGRVRFNYNQNVVTGNSSGDVSRRDKATRYVALRSFAFSGRLDQIVAEITADGQNYAVVSQYDLAFEYAPDGGPTRLVSLAGSFRAEAGDSLQKAPATQFNWETKDAVYNTVAAGTTLNPQYPAANGQELHAFADVNGDGRDDLIDFRTAGSLTVSLANGSGFDAPANWISNSAFWTGPATMARMCDVDGDGLKDIVFARYRDTETELKLYALVSDGSSFKPFGGGTNLAPFYTIVDEFRDPPAAGGLFAFLKLERESCVARLSVADFTGDGRDDILIHRYDGQLQVLRSAGASFIKLSLVGIGANQLQGEHLSEPFSLRYLGFSVAYRFSVSPLPCDLNGDGLVDYVWTETMQDWKNETIGGAATSTVSGSKNVYAVTALPGGGFSQLVYIAGTSWYWNDAARGAHRANAFVLMPGDVNGDGLTDLTVMMRAEEDDASVYNNGGWAGTKQCLLRMQTHISLGSPGEPRFSALNLCGGMTNSIAQVNLNGVWGNPWFDKVPIGSWVNDRYSQPGLAAAPVRPLILASGLSGNGDNMTMTDINGDGRTDYVWYSITPNRQGWWVMYSQGARFAAPTQLAADKLGWKPSLAWASGDQHPPMSTRSGLDLNGDGISDYTYFGDSYELKPGVQGYHISSGRQGLRLASIVDGLNRRTDIAYKPITDNSVYTKGVAIGYPVRELRNATYVVSEMWKDSGSTDTANRAHFSYQYSGNRLDLSGRGALGFHSFVTIDRQTNLFKYQFLAQSFPMTGLTAREQTYRYWEQGSDVKFRLVNSHDNTVVFDEVVNPANSTAWGTVYPFISKAIEYRWEDATTAHFTYAKAGCPESKPEALFTAARPAGHHIAISAESLFDNQTTAQTTIPGSYKASDRTADWASSGTNTVTGSTSYGTFHSLFDATGYRKITYGNLKQLTTNFGDGFTESVSTNYFTPSEVGGLTGLVKDVTTTTGSTAFGTETAPIKRYTYWQKGTTWTPLPATEKVDATDNALDLTTTYTRDDLGRVTRTEIAGTDLNSNSSVLGSTSDSAKAQHIGSFTTAKNTAFDSKWDQPTSSENAYGHTTTVAYHAFLGLPTSVKDANNAEVTTTYDALGRKRIVTDVLKNLTTTYEYAWTLTSASDWTKTVTVTPPSGVTGVGPGAPITGVSAITASSVYAIRTTATVQPPVTAYYDRLGRVIRTVKEGFAGQQAVTDTVYNTLGQTIATSLPYSAGTTAANILWTKTTYDALGRVATVTAPNGTVTTNTYNGRCTTVTVDATDRDPQSNTTYVDAKGRTIKVWNADNAPSSLDPSTGSSTTASIEYKLDGFGRMRETVLKDQSAHITATYDALGRQLSLNDPDKGNWTYVNNALGHVVKQTDAKGTVTLSSFDRLGRPLSRKTTETAGPVETADWYYYDFSTDSTLHTVGHIVGSSDRGWIGAPQRETSQTTGAPGYGDPGTASVHYFDTKGRPYLNLNQADRKYFYTSLEYDTYSRPSSVRYFWRPAGHEDAAPSASDTPYYWNDWGYTYTYDAESYLLTLQDTASTPRTWWQADTTSGYDHLDRPVLVRKGNGHWTSRTYRATDGLLTAIKTGPTVGSTDIQNLGFSYDGLGNLTGRTGPASESFAYDALNRLKTSSIGGTTEYYDNGNIKTKTGVDGTALSSYVYGGSRPHAVTSVSVAGSTVSLDYDANGNLLTRTGGGHTWST